MLYVEPQDDCWVTNPDAIKEPLDEINERLSKREFEYVEEILLELGFGKWEIPDKRVWTKINYPPK